MPYFLKILQFLSQDVAVPPIYSGWVNKVFNGSMALIFRTPHLSSDKIWLRCFLFHWKSGMMTG
ncbi:hypothetical protein AXF13_09030 [Desulfovibrio fairfieldensis]|uniref:Uncharacterized protein n=1 Tax=Desulfovibrio fairfieldensis TaxID=44742 RepID=A0A0X8JKG7_9BACT|nr:hypothetical protein AXF13_09030 [Desulfovibrio fairfieldensis]